MVTTSWLPHLPLAAVHSIAADPGYTATDLNGHSGPRTVDEAAVIAVELATLDAMGPTGGYFHDGHARRLSRYAW